jgi:hypothetical protein
LGNRKNLRQGLRKTIEKIGGKVSEFNCRVNVLAPLLWNGCTIREYHLLIG